ncbi:MAG: EamA family transporter [bacterium]|nr:EamA family transporter [bacterium]
MPSAAPTVASPLLVWAALGVVYVVWGSTYLAIHVALETLPSFLGAGTRFLVAGGILYAWARWRGGARERPGPRQWRATAIVGGALLGGGNGGVVWAQHYIPSGVAALLVAVMPVWMALAARVLQDEPLRPRTVLGLGLGVAGIALLAGPVDTGGVHPLGVVVCTLASISWAVGSVWSRRAPLPPRAALATGMEMLAGGALLLVVGVLAGEPLRMDLAAASTRSWLALGYLVVFGSLLAFSCYVWLLGHAPTSLIGTYAFVNPVVAVLLGWAILGEPITPRMLVAGAVILGAVALIVSQARTPARAAPLAANGARATSARVTAG